MQTLIIPTTAVATSNSFSGTGKNNIAFCCNALQGTETITLQVYDGANSATNWANAVYKGNLYQLTATSNFMSISSDAQIYRLVKSSTATAVGLDTNSDIKFGGLPSVAPTI